MDHHQQQHFHAQQQQNEENNNGSGGGGSSKSSFLCRQSSTRWIPTTDQIRILKDLYYNSGLRSPNADQIQRISARLRQYGKIEGKNVFYWFQNHKARERQKKRLTVDIAATNNKFSSNNNMMSPAGISPTSHAVYGLGQMGSSGGGGSVLMERAYMECSLPVEANVGWVGVETGATVPQFYYHQQRPTALPPPPPPPHHYYDDGYYYNNNHLQHQHHQLQEEEEQDLEEEEEEEEEETDDGTGIETLPLFPIHSQQLDEDGRQSHNNTSYFQSYFLGQQQENEQVIQQHNSNNNNNMETSLELTLNSYYATTPHGSA